jgi:hypothetical protein
MSDPHAVPASVHPDTKLVDQLTAWFNTQQSVSGADTVEYVSLLISGSGRPLLRETWSFTTDLDEDRHGLTTATVTAGPFTILVTQTVDDSSDLTVAITTTDEAADHRGLGLAVTVDDRPVVDPSTRAARVTVAVDPQHSPPA